MRDPAWSGRRLHIRWIHFKKFSSAWHTSHKIRVEVSSKWWKKRNCKPKKMQQTTKKEMAWHSTKIGINKIVTKARMRDLRNNKMVTCWGKNRQQQSQLLYNFFFHLLCISHLLFIFANNIYMWLVLSFFLSRTLST